MTNRRATILQGALGRFATSRAPLKLQRRFCECFSLLRQFVDCGQRTKHLDIKIGQIFVQNEIILASFLASGHHCLHAPSGPMLYFCNNKQCLLYNTLGGKHDGFIDIGLRQARELISCNRLPGALQHYGRPSGVSNETLCVLHCIYSMLTVGEEPQLQY